MRREWRDRVQVIMPEPEGPSRGPANATGESVVSASSAADDSTIAEKTMNALPQEIADMVKDPKRKARSSDPGWKYGFWPELTKKEMIKCIFCLKVVPAGIKRFKQHLAGGFGDTAKCPKAPEIVRKEMVAYLKKNARTRIVHSDNEEEGQGQHQEDVQDDEVTQTTKPAPSSETKGKQIKKIAQASISGFMVSAPVKSQTEKQSKSVNSLLCRSPEEVVAERFKSEMTQPNLEHMTKKNKVSNMVVDDHVEDFLLENGVSFNVVNSRSWHIMLESIGQYGPGYRSPSYHDVRYPLLDRAVDRTTDLRKRHEEAWKEYGCSIMFDGWTSTQRHIINFFANSPAGTFFIGSVDASSEVASASMLANLLEKQIDKVGKEHVVQVVTDNESNFKAAGRILMERIPTLFWTPCVAHCLDLMLEDIGKINEFHSCITHAKKVTRFIYKHGRLLDIMRVKIGGDLVRSAVTRFATSFLTLASMQRHKQSLRGLFVSEEWHQNPLSASREGQQVESIVLSIPFWTKLENCIQVSQPLLVALRIADGDETPAMPEIMAAMDVAKTTIKNALSAKPQLLAEVMSCYDKRWDNQMEQRLYGAALFLNPAKFFPLREKDRRSASRLRFNFNDVLWKMVIDEDEQSKISKQADDYERSEGECFSKPLAIRERDKKNPILWWGAYGGLAFELQCIAKRIVSLCCSTSGCERNWSTFAHIHTRKRNRLEHKRLNKMVYVSYNRKMANRFQTIKEKGSKGEKNNPLMLQEFEWENEWVDENIEEGAAEGSDLWRVVDEVVGAAEHLRGRNLPRAPAARGSSMHTYTRKRARTLPAISEPPAVGAVEDSDEEMEMETQGQGDGGGDGSAGDQAGDDFRLLDDLLD